MFATRETQSEVQYRVKATLARVRVGPVLNRSTALTALSSAGSRTYACRVTPIMSSRESSLPEHLEKSRLEE